MTKESSSPRSIEARCDGERRWLGDPITVPSRLEWFGTILLLVSFGFEVGLEIARGTYTPGFDLLATLAASLLLATCIGRWWIVRQRVPSEPETSPPSR